MTLYSRILSTGSALPAKAYSNDEIAARLLVDGVETSDEWIRTRTGIEQRYLAGADETTTSMACQAAKQALERSGLKVSDIDLIIVATTTPDSIFPSTACQVQGLLGCSNAAAFDLQAVCSGFAYSMSVADSMIRSGNFKTALVIGSETLSRILDWKDRTTCVLFGDGAGAIVLQASEEPGILSYEMKADGEHGAHVLGAPACFNHGAVEGEAFIQMNGKAVFRAAIEKMTESAQNVLTKAHLTAKDIDLYIPHQANLRIMSVVCDKLGIDPAKMMMTVKTHGNTSAASVPLALDKAVTQGLLKRGDKVLLQGVGGGFTWASVLLQY